ncbi:MAG: hypothetical protein QOG87_3906 [Actinomycetota bacterium]
MRKSTLALYAPFIAIAVVQALFIALLPSNGAGTQNVAAGQLGNGQFDAGTGAAADAGGAPVDAGAAAGVPAGAAGGGSAAALAQSKASAAAKQATQQYLAGQGDTSHCKNGKQFQIFYATKTDPNCVAKWPAGADNGGDTYQGVTRDTIKVIVFEAEPNAAVNAALAPQGLAATDEEIKAMDAAAQKFIAKHYELYGRKIQWERIRGDCPTTPPDYDSCLAAAREVIKKKPFMVIWYSGLYATVFDEWAKAGIVSIGGWHFDEAFFTQRRPYRYDVFMDGTRSADLIGEYYCKKLAGKNADRAGATTFPGTAQPIRATHRRLGISVPEIPANVSTAKHVAAIVNKCDPGHDPVIATYESNIERAQEQSSSTTQKFIAAKVTTTVCMCDPIAPVFGTKGYTEAGYFPEILLPGIGLLDYDKLGRLYSPQQMQHAFGPSHLRDETNFHDSDASIVWRDSGNSGEPCKSCNLAWAYYAMAASLLQGTGPILNPLNMEKAALSSKPNGGWAASGGNRNVIMTKLGPNDYTAVSDAREVYWDPSAVSKIDGQPGAYVSITGGRRWENGTWPGGLSNEIPVRP